MNPASIDLIDENRPCSSDDENEISFSSVSSVSSARCSSSSLYTTKQLEILLRTEKQKYHVLPNEKTKNMPSWWRSFGFPAISNDKNQFERIHGYISCTKCYRTSVYGSKSGTKRFIEHANHCSPLSSSHSSIPNDPQTTLSTLDNIVIKKKNITTKEQNEIKELYAKWICEDLCPFSIVEDNGFKQLAQTFIQIGSRYGCIDAEEVLRSRQTVTRTVDELAKKYRTMLKKELCEPLKLKALTIAPDFWASKHNQQAFLGINITYVTFDYDFKSVDLFCIPFDGKKSHDLILKVLSHQLLEYGIIDLLDVNIVSDRGSNFVKAFAVYSPIYCFGHRLNNILKICFFQTEKKTKQSTLHLSNETTARTTHQKTVASATTDPGLLDDSDSESSEDEKDQQELNVSNEETWIKFQKIKPNKTSTAEKMAVGDIPDDAKKTTTVLKQTKKLVKYVKKTSLNQEIKAAGGTTLHQASVVRWLSLSDLLQSVMKSFKATKKVLSSKQKLEVMDGINDQYLKQLILLLNPFKHIMTLIQCGNSPSLHLVSLCFITLKETLGSYELLIKYNKENADTTDEGTFLRSLLNDEDLEHELPGIGWFRQRLLLLLKEMFILDIRHVAATLLHPRYRSLKKLPDHLKNQCYRYVRQQIKHLRDKANSEENFQDKPFEPEPKKMKKGTDLFSRFESGSCDEDVHHGNQNSSGSDEYEFDPKKSDELDRYLLIEIDKNKYNVEPLKFWKNHRAQFPFLSQYARSILSIPATTTNVQREFSTAGWLLNQRRTSLKPSEVDKILLVRSMEKRSKKY